MALRSSLVSPHLIPTRIIQCRRRSSSVGLSYFKVVAIRLCPRICMIAAGVAVFHTRSARLQLMRANQGNLPRERFKLVDPRSAGLLGRLSSISATAAAHNSWRCLRICQAWLPHCPALVTLRFISNGSRRWEAPWTADLQVGRERADRLLGELHPSRFPS